MSGEPFMPRWCYAALLAASLAAALLVPAEASAAPLRPAVVLVNQPVPSVCVGRTFKVGVWYQQSGGSRAYRLDVYSPRGRRVLYKHGQAPTVNWKFWKVRATMAGKYRTVYWGHWKNPRKWSPYRATTRAHRC